MATIDFQGTTYFHVMDTGPDNYIFLGAAGQSDPVYYYNSFHAQDIDDKTFIPDNPSHVYVSGVVPEMTSSMTVMIGIDLKLTCSMVGRAPMLCTVATARFS